MERIDQPADDTADKDGRRSRKWQIDPYGKRQTGHATELKRHGDHDTDQDQTPRESPIENAIDNQLHQDRFGRIELAF